MNKFILGIDYYIENDMFVLTRDYHVKRGRCCGNGCKHCPFEPVHEKGNTIIKDIKKS